MQKFQKSRARKILAAAQATRLALAAKPPSSPSEMRQRQKLKIAREKRLSAALSRAGIDLAMVKGFASKPDKPLRRWEQYQARAAKTAKLADRTLRRDIDSRRAAIESLVGTPFPLPLPFPQPYHVALDTPFLVTRTYGMVMEDSNIEPWNSWARVRTIVPSLQGSGTLVLSFYHLWQNPGAASVLVDAHSYLVLKGGATADATSGFFPDADSHVELSIDVQLHPLEWWNQPPTSPPVQADQSQNIMSLHAVGDGWLYDIDYDEQIVFRGYDLSYRSWGVPPQATAIFETSLSVTYNNSGDNTSFLADFAGSAEQFSVTSVGVLLSVSPRVVVTW